MVMTMATIEKPTLEWIRTEFNLPASISSQCTQYVLRIFDGNYVYENVREGELMALKDIWIAHWQSTPEVVRSASRVACSFREFKGMRYVVIKVWQGEKE